MYKIINEKEFPMELNTLSFAERYHILKTNSTKQKVVYIKDQFDNSTFRYRCYNFRQALKSSEKFEITYFLTSEIPEVLKNIDQVTILVLQRTNWDLNVEKLIHIAKFKNIPLVFDMDDLLYKIEQVPFYMNHIGVEFTKKNIGIYLNIAAFYEMVTMKCDFFIATTSFLKKQLETDFHKPTFVIPNFLNEEQIEESKKIVAKRKKDNKKFVIGYFSGSASHQNDFKIIENDLVLLLDKYENIDIKIVGFMELNDTLKKYLESGRITFQPLVPYQALQYEIGSVDVNVIPLVPNDFNEAKSELKYFEAGILKIPSCLTKTKVYESFLEDGKNGFYCQTGEWFLKIEQLYLDEELRENMGNEAFKTTISYYLPEKQTTLIENVYQEIIKQKK